MIVMPNREGSKVHVVAGEYVFGIQRSVFLVFEAVSAKGFIHLKGFRVALLRG